MDGGPELNDQSHHHQRELREEIVFSLWSKANRALVSGDLFKSAAHCKREGETLYRKTHFAIKVSDDDRGK